MVTAGVFNPRTTASVKAHEDIRTLVADEANGRFNGYIPTSRCGSSAPRRRTCRGARHFLVYCVIARADGKAFEPDDPFVPVIVYDLVEKYLRDTKLTEWAVVEGTPGPDASVSPGPTPGAARPSRCAVARDGSPVGVRGLVVRIADGHQGQAVGRSHDDLVRRARRDSSEAGHSTGRRPRRPPAGARRPGSGPSPGRRRRPPPSPPPSRRRRAARSTVMVRTVVALSLRRQNAAKSCSPTRRSLATVSAARSSGRGQAMPRQHRGELGRR